MDNYTEDTIGRSPRFFVIPQWRPGGRGDVCGGQRSAHLLLPRPQPALGAVRGQRGPRPAPRCPDAGGGPEGPHQLQSEPSSGRPDDSNGQTLLEKSPASSSSSSGAKSSLRPLDGRRDRSCLAMPRRSWALPPCTGGAPGGAGSGGCAPALLRGSASPLAAAVPSSGRRGRPRDELPRGGRLLTWWRPPARARLVIHGLPHRLPLAAVRRHGRRAPPAGARAYADFALCWRREPDGRAFRPQGGLGRGLARTRTRAGPLPGTLAEAVPLDNG